MLMGLSSVKRRSCEVWAMVACARSPCVDVQQGRSRPASGIPGRPERLPLGKRHLRPKRASSLEIGWRVSRPGLVLRPAVLAFLLLSFCPWPALAQSETGRTVVVLYPESSVGSPGSILVDENIRSTFAAGSAERIEIHNQYLEMSFV